MMSGSTEGVSEASAPVQVQDEDSQYAALLELLRVRFQTGVGDGPLFTTTVSDLFPIFLAELPADRRQHYNCNHCRSFVNRFGGLVRLDALDLRSVLWHEDGVPPFFRAAVAALRARVERAKIAGVFLSSEAELGTASNVAHLTGLTWKHMAVTLPEKLVFRHATKTAEQIVAERREDRAILERGLQEFSEETVQRAHQLLTNGTLYRSEACTAVAEWLCDLHNARAAHTRPSHREAIVWNAVATAPAGFCHVRSTMIGTLLEDLQAGMAFETVKARFDAKMDPMKYQRPTAAPSDGQLAQAEKIVERLKAAGALDRRFAKLTDLTLLWKPQEPKPVAAPEAGGVFGHLKGSQQRQQGAAKPKLAQMPAVKITWVKFAATVLPAAESMTVDVPAQSRAFMAMVTAVNPDAPPIVQWDRPEARNPVSWYFPAEPLGPASWNLKTGEVKVTGITLKPSMLPEGGKGKDHGNAAFFLLEGARDERGAGPKRGGGFFPEILRGEFHEVRKTMEAYAKTAVVQGHLEGDANGIAFSSGSNIELTVHVVSKGTRSTYRIDRWD